MLFASLLKVYTDHFASFIEGVVATFEACKRYWFYYFPDRNPLTEKVISVEKKEIL